MSDLQDVIVSYGGIERRYKDCYFADGIGLSVYANVEDGGVVEIVARYAEGRWDYALQVEGES